jgi:hypothetical protein
MIIDLASTLAYLWPSFATVRARVASATEGAAPNSPAKLLGFKRSPNREKAETTIPPIATLQMISFIRSEWQR